MRLGDGLLSPTPITLEVTETLASSLSPGARLALRDEEGGMLAALYVEDVWHWDRETEATAVFGTTKWEHPGVAHLLDRTQPGYVGGRVPTPTIVSSATRPRSCRTDQCRPPATWYAS